MSPASKVIKLFSCSTQLSMTFEMLMNVKVAQIDGVFRFNSSKMYILRKNVKFPILVGL